MGIHLELINKKTDKPGGVAQLGEHLPCKQGVKSSILFVSTIFIMNLENFIEENYELIITGEFITCRVSCRRVREATNFSGEIIHNSMSRLKNEEATKKSAQIDYNKSPKIL